MFKKDNGAIDMVSLILTVVIAAVTLMVGLTVVANMETSMPSLSASTLSSSLTEVITNTGTAFTKKRSVLVSVHNFLALGMFVLAAVKRTCLKSPFVKIRSLCTSFGISLSVSLREFLGSRIKPNPIYEMPPFCGGRVHPTPTYF